MWDGWDARHGCVRRVVGELHGYPLRREDILATLSIESEHRTRRTNTAVSC